MNSSLQTPGVRLCFLTGGGAHPACAMETSQRVRRKMGGAGEYCREVTLWGLSQAEAEGQRGGRPGSEGRAGQQCVLLVDVERAQTPRDPWLGAEDSCCQGEVAARAGRAPGGPVKVSHLRRGSSGGFRRQVGAGAGSEEVPSRQNSKPRAQSSRKAPGASTEGGRQGVRRQREHENRSETRAASVTPGEEDGPRGWRPWAGGLEGTAPPGVHSALGQL